MKISTIMVCRNAARTIRGAVASFLAQDHPDKELLVIDGASTDGTQEIVESFSSPLITLRSAPDRGLYDAMNKGLAAFSGDAFGFLNADDRYHDAGVLSLIAEGLASHEMVVGDLAFVTGHDGGRVVRHWAARAIRPGDFARGFSLAHPPTYARRSVYDRVGPFELQYAVAADYDWLLRAVEIEGITPGIVPGTLVDMAMGGISTSGLGARLRNAREKLRVRQARLGSGPVDAALFLGPLRSLGQLRRSATGPLA